MRSISWLFILTSVICARVACAAETATVDIPFSFEAQGKIFPASRYDVILQQDRSRLTLTSKTNPAQTITCMPIHAGMNPNDAVLSIKFDLAGTMHELRTVRFGEYQTLVLDTHSDHARHREPGQSGQ